MPTPRDLRRLHLVDTRMDRGVNDDAALLEEYVDYMCTMARRRWRAETVRVRRYQLGRILTALPRSIRDTTEADLQVWRRTMSGAEETVAGYTSAVRGLFRWAAVLRRPRVRGDDPAAILERPVIPEAVSNPISNPDFDLALACAVAHPEMYAWLGLMGCCGFRCCEVAWLKVRDVEHLDDGRGILRPIGKGGKRRAIPAGVYLMRTLRPFLDGGGPVFTRPSDGGPHTPKGVSERVKAFLRSVGVEGVTAHNVRHRFSHDYHALDPDLYRQAKLMGHASIDTLQRYLAVSPLEAAEYIDVMTARRLRPRRDVA